MQCVQRKTYGQEFSCLAVGRNLFKDSPLRKLNPYVEKDGLLRVGGRLSNLMLNTKEKLPLVIPGRSHVATLLLRHYHERVKHQGCDFTEGAIRSAGNWIVGARRCIDRVLHKCVMRNKLRGRAAEQKMGQKMAQYLLEISRASAVPVKGASPDFLHSYYSFKTVFGVYSMWAVSTRTLLL